ncbi:DUF551 domain-containing protein [Sphingobium sp. CR2-8]|uniref:DUF551 domain-containing protein n=1 Tax=Sphingobium sp. CR2-8 TaxID=1306534 RepID=UPI002DBB91B4|nr:DUF551 domain-containing protein [Sphingobium sp. CR2-8]MEC3912356.1 DUF551 domain-containing protein [Sphingobium sp. CR2-8]
MTDTIAELRELLALATPRPWEYLNTSGTIVQKIDRLTTYVIAEMQTSNETIDAKLIAAAINALPALLDRVEAGEWRPIETAPKDGTWVLIYAPDLEIGVTMGCYYREEERNSESGRFVGGEWTGAEWDGAVSGYLRPTHWRPLPDAPQQKADTP